jgi:hypothetical protein
MRRLRPVDLVVFVAVIALVVVTAISAGSVRPSLSDRW